MVPLRKYPGDVWDRRAESRLYRGEPVAVRFLEGQWAYIASGGTEGYVKCGDLELCTKGRYFRYCRKREGRVRVVIKGGRTEEGVCYRVGTLLLPKQERRFPRGGKEVMHHKGEEPIWICGYLPFTKRQIFLQMNRMLGIPYSWGDERNDGMDCSSTVRGFFACFGLFLPRNSEEQRRFGECLCAGNRAEYEEIGRLSRSEKLRVLSELGPGAVLHMSGHVMIYAGERDGIPHIFHNCDTYREEGEEKIIRRSVLSEFLPKGEGTYLDYVTAAWKPKL